MSSRAASRVDTNSVVLAECRAAGIIPVVIPAKLTGLLQPLDTHAFAAYKHSSSRPVLAEVAELSRVFQALAKAKPRAQPKPAAKPKAKAKAAAPTPRQVAEGGA